MKSIGLLISSLNSGGAERVVSHLSFILSQEYNVHIILFESSKIEYKFEGKLHDLNVRANDGGIFSKIVLFIKRIKKLKSIITMEKLDCVISFLDSPNFVNLFTGENACKKIISVRNYSSLENRQSVLGRIVDSMMKLVYRRADTVVTVSKLMEMEFVNTYKIPEEQICTIYNPYNFAEISAKSQETLSEEEEHFFADHFVYINVGRIMYQKGIWHLVKSFSDVHKRYAGTRLVLVGNDLSDGKLLELIRKQGLEEAVLLTGATSNPYKYMYRADAYVLSSMFEGFPNAMVEAMACGCATIAADCKSGPREILCDIPDLNQSCDGIEMADYGVLVAPLEKNEDWSSAELTDGEKNLADAMSILIEKSGVCQELSEKAQTRSHVFSYDSCGRAFRDAIEG